MAKVKEEKEAKIKFILPKLRGTNAEDQVFVSVNSKNYIIQRGVEVEVPLSVVEVLMNSDIAQDMADAYIRATSKASSN